MHSGTVVVTIALAFTACAGLAAAAPSAQLPTEMRGDILMARKMYREAIAVYSQEPETVATRWNKIGIAYHQLADLRLAKKFYETALRIEPHYGEARNNLGTVYYAEKSYRRAVREYKRALRELPGSASVYSNLGTAYFARQDYKRAGDSYQEALRLDPDVFEHHSTFGVLMQDHTVAERAKFHYYLAKMYAKQGSTDRALQYVRKALEEGFNEPRKFMEESEFAGLRENATFQQILKSDPRVL